MIYRKQVHFSTSYNLDLTLHDGRRPQKELTSTKRRFVVGKWEIGLQTILSNHVLENNLIYIKKN
jgi:hypothetical protein